MVERDEETEPDSLNGMGLMGGSSGGRVAGGVISNFGVPCCVLC
jgi:hypothetical protein